MHLRRIFAGIVILTTVTACGEEPKNRPPIIRAVKTITVTEPAKGQLRRISGTIKAVNSSTLSFEVGGTVQKVSVSLGDRVRKAQVLAVLDRRPFELNLSSVQADLRKAQADLAEKTTRFEARRNLYAKGVVSKADFERAEAEYKAAGSAVDAAKAKVRLAKRDLDNTSLKAPFDGVIAMKGIEPFVTVVSGKVIFEIQGEGDLEVSVSVPDSIVKFLRKGQSVTVRLPTQRNRTVQGTINEIGSQASEANAFPLTVSITKPDADIRPGTVAEVDFVYRSAASQIAYLIPISAIIPGSKISAGSIFTFDRATSTVRKTAIKGRNIRDNMVEIIKGIAPGDIVVVAGVSFLRDGQKVSLLQKTE